MRNSSIRSYIHMDLLNKILEQHDIKYVAVAGTILGLNRHGGIIPWDNDIDIGFIVEEWEKLMKIKDILFKNGFNFHEFCDIHCQFGSIDCFKLVLRKEYYAGGAGACCHKDEYAKISKQFFGYTYIYAPHCSIKSLTHRYGKDYFNIGDVNDNFHFKDKSVGRFKLNKYDHTWTYLFNLPVDFNEKIYKELNADLKDINDIDAKIHYIIHGIREGRLYKYEFKPKNFDSELYHKLNYNVKNNDNLSEKIYNSIIQTTARDEDFIINEWIVHYILLGFEHIYIYDDNSIIPISETVEILPKWIQDKLTIYRLTFDKFIESEIENTEYYNFYKSTKHTVKQNFIVEFFIFKHKHLSNWCLFCDVDEFIYLKDHENINSFLENYQNKTNLYIPWLNYGTSYIIDNIYNDNLVMDYNKYHDNHYCECGKSLTNFNKLNSLHDYHIINIHDNYIFDRKTKLFDLPIHINHYNKIDVKTFLRRKLRDDMGLINCERRSSKNIFELLIINNNTNSHFEKMDKYISKIIKVITKKQLNYYLDLNKNSNLCPTILYCNNNLIFDNNITDNILYDLLNDKNLRYINFDEVLPKDFDVSIYKELNEDLKDMNDIDVKLHYINHGIREGRFYKYEGLPIDFDVSIYKELNEDLAKINDSLAKLHYINHGIREGRFYKYEGLPIDFDVSIYKELNEDLVKINDSLAKLHYINHGIKEGRLYKNITT